MADNRSQKVTLENVAAIANVSKITASRAFSQPDKVHPDTLKRILEAADKIGYVVNAAARSLRAKSSNTIGIVSPDMANPFFGGLAKLMTQEAYRAGYDTLLFDSYESKENEARIIDKLIGYNVDAIILSVVSAERFYRPDYIKQLELLNIPVILVDREMDIKHCSGVYIDNLDCGLQAGRYLLSQKAKNIVIISGPEDSNVARDRVTGLQAALQGNVDNIEILYADFLMNEAYNATNHYLKHHQAPDYFVGCNNQISLGIIKSCINHQLALLKDVSLFSIDEVSYATIYGFNFPCISHDLQEIAWQAVSMAVRRASDKAAKPGKVIVRGKLGL
ncbi:HTH-type transcriptional repressor CytR [Pragia fontium]|uniref:Transcriptional regulator, LacI family n=2 Tax=Pragia fontium TaxID=82985 RepID=A0AAJ4WCV2_9GAMM|nr:LacI family transcriptional regulator [Pragia fontium]GKX64437.1 LacI family transcriptional regulator [Pragia fontium]SFD28388.1 transcriptional regulator, LacI family [Pragia fontium DSM 5563 = ATCC 49100]SUB83895.1 HTH-type transcriptional repressor CytR [Pragia fontium]VEJ56801.1 HTH-type transcriptional repressor CytR [Pragia fontium]